MIKRMLVLLASVTLIVMCGCGGKVAEAPKVKEPPKPVRVVQLLPGTPYDTPAYIYSATTKGPAVMVVGGMHGNEPAGALAAAKFKDVELLKGTLIVIPRANETALQKNVRTLPEVGDLNRAYPGREKGLPSDQLTYGIVKLMKEYQVAMVLDLHEGYAFNIENKKSVGETILPGKDDKSTFLAIDAIDYINKQITDPKKKFSVLANPIKGSTAYYANTVLGVPAFTIETSDKQPLEDRTNFSFKIASFIIAEGTGIIAQPK
jgi:predicted deacylase